MLECMLNMCEVKLSSTKSEDRVYISGVNYTFHKVKSVIITAELSVSAQLHLSLSSLCVCNYHMCFSLQNILAMTLFISLL